MGNTHSELTFLLIISISKESTCSNYLIPFIHAIYEINGKSIPNENKLINKNQLKDLLKDDILECKVINLQERKKQTFIIKNKSNSLGISVKLINSIPNFLCIKPLNIIKSTLLNKFDRIIGVEGTYIDSLENFFRYLFINRNQKIKLVILNIGMQNVRTIDLELKSEFNFLGFEVLEISEEEKIELASSVKNVFNFFGDYKFQNTLTEDINKQEEDINKQEEDIKQINHLITPSVVSLAEQLNSIDSNISLNYTSELPPISELNIKEKYTNELPKEIPKPIIPLKGNKKTEKNNLIKKYATKKKKIDLTFEDLNIKNTPIPKLEKKKMEEKQVNDILKEVCEETLIDDNTASFLNPSPEVIVDKQIMKDNPIKDVPNFFKTSNNKKFTLDDLMKKK